LYDIGYEISFSEEEEKLLHEVYSITVLMRETEGRRRRRKTWWGCRRC